MAACLVIQNGLASLVSVADLNQCTAVVLTGTEYYGLQSPFNLDLDSAVSIAQAGTVLVAVAWGWRMIVRTLRGNNHESDD